MSMINILGGTEKQPHYELPSSASNVAGGIANPEAFYSAYNEEVKKATEEQRQWSAEQAQKQMDFQERMSNTAYQRAKKDMMSAGLNPYLMMSGISPSSSPTGTMASTTSREVYNKNDTLDRDLAIMQALTQVLGSILNSASKVALPVK